MSVYVAVNKTDLFKIITHLYFYPESRKWHVFLGSTTVEISTGSRSEAFDLPLHMAKLLKIKSTIPVMRDVTDAPINFSNVAPMFSGNPIQIDRAFTSDDPDEYTEAGFITNISMHHNLSLPDAVLEAPGPCSMSGLCHILGANYPEFEPYFQKVRKFYDGLPKRKRL